MDEKAALLEQLRIERPAPAPARTSGGARRALIGLGVAVVVLAVAAAAWSWEAAHGAAVPVHVATARTVQPNEAGAPVAGSLLDASGYVVALRDATVSGKSVYKVSEMLVQQGQSVKAGQVIARLDDSNVRAGLQEAQAQVAQARAQLAQAKLAAADDRPTYLRQQKELADGLISQDAFDTTQAAYDAYQATVGVAEQSLALGQAAVVVNQRLEDDTVIRAPFAGVVTATSAQPGQIVSPQFSGGGGLAEIVDMNSLEVDVDVSENFISRVHPGQPATITLDAYPDWHIPAHVIAIIPTADKSKATVSVRVGFKPGDPRVLPQMGARVSFLADAPAAGASPAGSGSAPSPSGAGNAAVTVASAAVETDSDSSSGTGTVFVIHGNTVVGRTVRLGARSGDNQWILSGLDPGASVAIGDFSNAQGQLAQIGDLDFFVDAIVAAAFASLLLLTGSTLMQTYRERIHEFAVMKTLGFTDRGISTLVLSEALLLTMAAAVLGLLLTHPLQEGLGSVMARARISAPDLHLPWIVFAVGIGFAVLLALVSALPPAWRAARLSVIDALAVR